MQELFPALNAPMRHALSILPQALQAVLPLNAAHRRTLPLAVEELSTRLTSERGLDAKPYWSAPRLTAAYIWYFLPWNILRLSRLLSALPLTPPLPVPDQQGSAPAPRILADMGSGPLTLPIALWLARPQWRDMPLTILCTDLSPHPLDLGQRLFQQLAGPDSPWRVQTVRAPLDGLDREVRRVMKEGGGVPWLVTAANVCNELKPRPQQSMDERLDALMEKLSPLLDAPDASLLMVEPGTRLGGKTIVSLRQAALEYGLTPLAPCPHNKECPLADSRTWCHFTFDVQGCPAWLSELSGTAGLRKEALSLAFVHLGLASATQEAGISAQPDKDGKARIVSAPFRVPGVTGMARYACHFKGLALLAKAQGLPSGALVSLRAQAAPPRRDHKSGALIMEHAEQISDFPSRAQVTKPERSKAADKRPWTKPEAAPSTEAKAAAPSGTRSGAKAEHRPENRQDDKRNDRPGTKADNRPDNRSDGGGTHKGSSKSSSREDKAKEKARKRKAKAAKKVVKKFWEK